MGLYRRLARSKRGMATIFGGLFFVILILMGFNLMLWGFIQQDAYNSVYTQMQQRDQQAISENIVPQQPGAQNFTSSPASFNIAVNNEGGTAVSILRIYINGLSGTTQCAGAPCVINPSGSTADPACSSCFFSNGNVPAGVVRQLIAVTGLDLTDCTTGAVYRVVLASSRGRLYSFACPWQAPPIVINNASVFTLNIGPLSISFTFNSFNFTRGSQTQSQPAWVLPSKTNWILWIKVEDIVSSPVTINVQSALLLQSYGGTTAQSTAFFIVNSTSTCPTPGGGCTNGVIPYCAGGVSNCTTGITLPAATSAGPGAPAIIKFAAGTQGSGSMPSAITKDGPYLAFIGFYYTLNGNFQGETVPFVATDVCSSYPAPC